MSCSASRFWHSISRIAASADHLGVRIALEQRLELRDRLAGRALVALHVAHLVVRAQPVAVERVGDLRVVRVQLHEVVVVARRLLVLAALEVDVADLQLRQHRVVAVRIVVDDFLEVLDRLGVIDVVEEQEAGFALERCPPRAGNRIRQRGALLLPGAQLRTRKEGRSSGPRQRRAHFAQGRSNAPSVSVSSWFIKGFAE